MGVEINTEGYCADCNIGHNCMNCKVMDQLIFFRDGLIGILDKKNEKKNNRKKKEKFNKTKRLKENIPHCGDCGLKMKKSKFKKGPLYWCPCSKKKSS